MDFVFSNMSSPHVDVSGARSTSASKLLSSCRLLDHQIPWGQKHCQRRTLIFFSVMCLWSFLLVNLAVICRLWSLRKRRSWSWRDVSSHRADAAEHPYHRSVPRSSWRVSSKAGHRQGRPGWNRKHARTWRFLAIEKAKRVRDADKINEYQCDLYFLHWYLRWIHPFLHFHCIFSPFFEASFWTCL